ncbi:MAG: hypothetical protein IKT58_06600 [Oscillospiraceae bacterium]|nr:hypothetical protein [Oscillospiraceae bacterium]
MKKHSKFFRALLAYVLAVACVLSLCPAVFATEPAVTVETLTAEEAEELIENSDQVLDFTSGEYDFSSVLENMGIETLPEEKPATRSAGNWSEYLFLDFRPLSPERDFGWYVNSWAHSPDQLVKWSAINQGRMYCYMSGSNAYVRSQTVKDADGNSFVIPSDSVVKINFYLSDSSDNLGVTKDSTTQVSTSIVLYFTDNTSLTITKKDGLILKEAYQTLTFTSDELKAAAGKTLSSIRIDFFDGVPSIWADKMVNTAKNVYLTSYVEYFYIGPEAEAPLYVSYYNGSSQLFWEYVPEGGTGTFNEHGMTNTATEVWGWRETYKSGGTYVETGNFYVNAEDAVVTHGDTRFMLDSLTLPETDITSGKELSSGADMDDDEFALTLDAINTAKIQEAQYATPQDITIILDRSGSMAEYAYADEAAAKSAGELWEIAENKTADEINEVLAKLDKTKYPGYYRATMWTPHQDGVLYDKWAYGSPLRYMNNDWYMQVQTGKYNDKTCTSCEGKLRANGIHQGVDVKPCKCVEWVKVTSGYTTYQTRRSNSSNNNSSYDFQIYVPRMTKAVEALTDFVDALYASSKNLAPGTYHSVSILSFGNAAFVKNYPYAYNNSVTEPVFQKTTYNYGSSSCVVTTLNASGYSTLINTARSFYLCGTTRADCAMQIVGSSTALSTNESGVGLTARVAAQSDYLAAKNSKRDRTLIFLTDGCPTENTTTAGITTLQYSNQTASIAINQAKTLKNAGVKIYTLGFMAGLDDSKAYNSTWASSGTDTQKANNFLNLMSSNYPTASATMKDNKKDCTYTTGTKSGSNYFKADTGAGADLGKHFTAILTSVAPDIELSKAGTLYIYDEITREFMLDGDRTVKVYAQAHTGNGEFSKEKVLIGEHTVDVTKSNQVFTTDAYTLTCTKQEGGELSIVTLKWTDCKLAYLRNNEMETNSVVPNMLKGYKIVLELPIVVNRDNTLGGNMIATNTDKSGLYFSNKDDTGIGTGAEIEYEVPKANVSPEYGFLIHDYFMELPKLASVAKNGYNSTADVFKAMTSTNVTIANGSNKSKLDYLSLLVEVKDEDGNVVYKNMAGTGAIVFTESVTAVESEFDFTLDQPMTVVYTVNQKNSGTDSVGREEYDTIISDPLTANYYAPKFAVVDFDGVASVSMQREADTKRMTVTGANGSYDAGEAVMKFDFRDTFGSSAQKQIMTDGWQTISYTYDSINTPKDGVDLRQRQVYILPGNVISYDDTLFTYGTVSSEALWKQVGIFGNDAQNAVNTEVHGYDVNYATTGDYHGASSMVTVTEKKPTANLASFEFFGTGFELLSRTAPDSGVMVVEIFKAKADGSYGTVADAGYLVDTYLAGNTLYQIPVVQHLTGETAPAKYKVNVIAVYDKIFDHNLKGIKSLTTEEARAIAGFPETVEFYYISSDSVAPATRGTAGTYNVYLDGCRIYNSQISDAQGIRDYVYSLANEADAKILNISSQIVDVTSKVDWSNGNAVSGMLFIAAPKAEGSDVDGDTGSNEIIDSGAQGFLLNMDGRLNVQQVGDKFFVCTPEGSRILHKDYQTEIYYKARPSKRVSFYCTDGAGEEVLLTDAEVRQYVGNGNSVVYYSDAYETIGPENEIYLSKGQGVAFQVSAANGKIFMSMKTINGKATAVKAYNGTSFVTVSGLSNYCSDAEMYFDLTSYVKNGVLMIQNGGDGILSLCNVKASSASGTVEPVVNTKLIRMAMEAFGMEAELPVVDENVSILHSLNLQSDIAVNLVVPAATLADYDRYVMECTIAGKTFVVEPQAKGQLVYFTVDGLTALQMTENIHSVLYLIKGDETYVSLADDYSIAYYAYTTLNKAEASNAIKTLCANLLRYGAMAQTYKNYCTDGLADEEMTDLHKSYLTDLDSVTFGNTNSVLEDLEGATASWLGKTMILDSKVTVMYIVDLSAYEGDLADLSLRGTYTNIKGETVEVELTELTAYNDQLDLYAFKLDTLLAAELRTVVSVAVYAGNTRVSKTLCYSADSYGNGKTGTLLDLCKALIAYSDSAKAFFE